jgi:hypothetical protein
MDAAAATKARRTKIVEECSFEPSHFDLIKYEKSSWTYTNTKVSQTFLFEIFSLTLTINFPKKTLTIKLKKTFINWQRQISKGRFLLKHVRNVYPLLIFWIIYISLNKKCVILKTMLIIV